MNVPFLFARVKSSGSFAALLHRWTRGTQSKGDSLKEEEIEDQERQIDVKDKTICTLCAVQL